MDVIIGQTIIKDFTISDPTTGMVSNATAVSCQVFAGNSNTPLLTPVPVLRTGQVGDYRVSFTASSANGFVIGQSYNIVVEATVAGITAKATIDSFILQSPLSLPVKTRI
jgi:hypothetical protein